MFYRESHNYLLQFSDDEIQNLECPWENPLFENTDQLMDERYV